jgi:hypothetical protein
MNTKDEYLLHDPKSFVILKTWLEVFNDKSVSDQSDLVKISRNIHHALSDFLSQQDFGNFINKVLLKNSNPIEIEKQKHFWFDAFRTLKLIHYLRDVIYPNINMFDAIDELFRLINIKNSIKRNSAIPDLETQKEYLKLLRKIQS